MIDFTKPLARRQFPTRQVRILATDIPGRLPVVSATEEGYVSSHRLDGTCPGSMLADLVPLQLAELEPAKPQFIPGQRLMYAGDIVTFRGTFRGNGDPEITCPKGERHFVQARHLSPLPNGQL